MGVTEIVTAAVQPANKLIDAVTGAIGKAYEPRHIRRMADAKAYEIKTIGDELRNNADLPIVYDASGEFSVDISDYEALAKRAGRRIAYQEVAKQENIETIVDAAYDSLQGAHEVGDGEISREWMHRFIDAAGDISTEELQKIWSKVLAGEVLEPSSFSLRTLECLRNLDVRDANLFEQLCKVVISNRFVINDNELLRKHGMPYAFILHLDESGLLNSSGTISFHKEISAEPELVLDFGDYILMAKSEENRRFTLPEFPLTAAGRELSMIVDSKMDLDLIKDICQVAAKNNSKINLTLHKVNYREEDSISYENTPIVFMDTPDKETAV